MKSEPRRIAVILADTLRSVGIQTLLSDYFPPVEIELFASFDEMARSGAGQAEPFDWYFMQTDTYAIHDDYFLPRRHRVVLLSEQDDGRAGSNLLPASFPQEEIVSRLGLIFSSARPQETAATVGRELSPREADVLRLIVRGRINREIADELSISFQTVLSHRKNITAKLGIKTVSGLTFYALMNGYVSADEIGI